LANNFFVCSTHDDDNLIKEEEESERFFTLLIEKIKKIRKKNFCSGKIKVKTSHKESFDVGLSRPGVARFFF